MESQNMKKRLNKKAKQQSYCGTICQKWRKQSRCYFQGSNKRKMKEIRQNLNLYRWYQLDIIIIRNPMI